MVIYVLEYSLRCTFMQSDSSPKLPHVALHGLCYFIYTFSHTLLKLTYSQLLSTAHIHM